MKKSLVLYLFLVQLFPAVSQDEKYMPFEMQDELKSFLASTDSTVELFEFYLVDTVSKKGICSFDGFITKATKRKGFLEFDFYVQLDTSTRIPFSKGFLVMNDSSYFYSHVFTNTMFTDITFSELKKIKFDQQLTAFFLNFLSTRNRKSLNYFQRLSTKYVQMDKLEYAHLNYFLFSNGFLELARSNKKIETQFPEFNRVCFGFK